MNDARLWWFIVARGPELNLRRRKAQGRWRLTCPVDSSHEVTFLNGKHVEACPSWQGQGAPCDCGGPLGLVLTCHGYGGADAPGHAAATHYRARKEGYDYNPGPGAADLSEVPFPCRFCGCVEAQLLAAFGARQKDRYRQRAEEWCRCGAPGWKVGKLPTLCLAHLANRVGLERDVLFGERPS